MEIRIRSVELAGSRCQTRLPFRFGGTTLYEAPLLLARVHVEAEGRKAIGYAGDLAVPRWFDKRPGRGPADDVRALFSSARTAAQAFDGAVGSAFSIWRNAHRDCVEDGGSSGVALVDGFGTALIERAVIDASCRAAELPFAEAMREGALGFEPGALLPETASIDVRSLVADPAPRRIGVRHTVGQLDALRRKDVPAELRGDDEHPVALEEDIERYGLSAFKLKLGGDPKADFARLLEIARVVAERVNGTPRSTLDANEQYVQLSDLGRMLDALAEDPDGRLLMDGLLYVEQPLPRARTLDRSTADDVRAVSATTPLLIDEADDTVDAFARALEIGYRGVSVKNCTGVFRAFANRALCLARGAGTFQSSEDLTNLPLLPLQQDLATVAALGLKHSERNGHHYFPGLDVVPPAEAEAALAAHPDLYERCGNRVVLRIERGELSVGSLRTPGFGYDVPISWSERTPIERLERELTR